MTDYRRHIRLDFGDELKATIKTHGLGRQFKEVDGGLKSKIQTALKQIASTPEGARLLRDVSQITRNNRTAWNKDGRIQIIQNPMSNSRTTAGTKGVIILGDDTRKVRYKINGSSQYHDMSLQRALYHELQHIKLRHKGITPRNEAQAIARTNRFMRKYYGEPNRTLNHDEHDQKGTPRYDLAKNFDPTGRKHRFIKKGEINTDPDAIKTRLASLTQEQARAMGPEVESLWQVREMPERLKSQMAELKETGGLQTAMSSISKLKPENLTGPTQTAQATGLVNNITRTGSAMTLG